MGLAAVEKGAFGLGGQEKDCLLPQGTETCPACACFSSPFLITHFLPQRGLGS